MFGLRLILILAVVGGLIAFIGDKLGSKIGKKKLSVFGLRPYHTSVLMTVITGILIASITLVTMAVASDSARTAMFGMEKLQNELAALNREKDQASVALAKAQADVAEKNKAILALDEQIKASAAEKAAIENQLVAAHAWPIAGGISCACAGPAMHALYGCLLVVPGTGCPPVTQVVRLKLFFCYR